MLIAGERAFDFTRRDLAGQARTFFEERCGEPRLLIVVGDGAAPAPPRADAPVFLLTAGERPTEAAGWTTAMVDDGAVTQRYGVIAGAAAFAIDARGRVRAAQAWHDGDDPAPLIAAARAPSPETPPPVLIVPDVLEPALTLALIQHFEAHGGPEPGDRREARLADDALDRAVEDRIQRRLTPELERAYSFRTQRREAFRIARYGADQGGLSRAHRDASPSEGASPDAARRRFAMSLTLNGDYQSGGLAFPEYAETALDPPPGGALVFSCALLHEARPVTHGQRYALLSFFS